MKLLLKLAVLCSFACLGAWAQCGTTVFNPITGQFDCVGKNGQGAQNISASSAGSVTSLTLNTTALNVANTQGMLVQCWTGTTTFAPVTISSLNPVTVSGGIVTVVTPNFSATGNVYCTASSNSGSGPTGGTGATGPAGANGTGNNTYCADATGSTTTYTCPSPTPPITTLSGLQLTLVPQATNTGASTVNPGGLGAKSLLGTDGVSALGSGALQAGKAYYFAYNGTSFVEVSGTITVPQANPCAFTVLAQPCWDTVKNQLGISANGSNYYPVPYLVGSFANGDCPQADVVGGFLIGFTSAGSGCGSANISGLGANRIPKATGATQITGNSNILEETTGQDSFLKAAAYAACATVTYTNGGTSTIDLSLGNCYSLTIATSGTTTLAVSNPPTGGAAFRLYQVQDATTAGSVTYPASFSNGAAPSLGLSSRCYQDFAYNSVTTKYEGGPQTCTDATGVLQTSEAVAPTTATYCGSGKGCGWFDSTDHLFEAKANNSPTVQYMVPNFKITGPTAVRTFTFPDANSTMVTGAAASAAKQLCTSGGATSTCSYIDYPDASIVPAANCNNTTAGAGWTLPATGFAAACRAGTNNLLGALQAIPNSANGIAYFDFELPLDWDTASQPYVNIFYGSGANASGTVIWTVSTACTKADGSVTDDPAFVANSAFATQTMAVANRGWSVSGQLTTVTSGNNCIGGSNMIIKLALTGTAASNINVYKAVVTVPRLLTVQAE